MNASENPGKSGPKNLKENWSQRKKTGVSSDSCKTAGIVSLNEISDEIAGKQAADAMEALFDEIAEADRKTAGVREIRPNFRSVTGWVMGDREHDPVPFESSLERDFAFLAFFDPAITRIFAQPRTIVFGGEDGQSRKYTPDFEIECYDCKGSFRTVIVEIKYAADLDEKADEYSAAFEAMRKICAAECKDFLVLTDLELRSMRLENVRALYPLRFGPCDDARRIANVADAVASIPNCTIKAALDSISGDRIDRAKNLGALNRLISKQELVIDLDEKIIPQSPIRLAGAEGHSEAFVFKVGSR